MKYNLKRGWLLLLGAIPLYVHAQAVSANSIGPNGGLNGVLDKLFEEMIPLAGRLIGVAQAIAGFAALWYIAARVWRHIARAEPIDFYPLLRPFALGLAILFFLPLVNLMNGILQPTVVGTRALAGDSQQAIFLHIAQEEQSLKEPPPVGAYPSTGGTAEYEQPDGSSDGSGFSTGLKSAFSFFSIKSIFKSIVTGLVNLLYEAVSLCINTIRTFYLIILVILGPIVLGLSVFDGFQHTLPNWFARYINIYMWLPVANIFGGITSKILENMMTLDQDFFSSTAYIIFMIISIVGYTTVPNIASHIVHVGGRDTLLHKVNALTRGAGKAAARKAGL
ncbi:Bacteroides conjugative transposon TraJ protein [Arachidicoccus rhizosphaerae]|uniref:Bacteroides conjugative transposon TraJ protein n=1 Tax=Arachidicoccus rhizosphaerae TaxID=551991 RepID=A0A1H3YU23_9BACT|nr:conjugative transposon protein TraJ [Arachidicoccus rhizosphaerae]SEA15036.1 Bacteroides conjugative transposon TraJ protein [Arachidicoccus rhizosphaerae]